MIIIMMGVSGSGKTTIGQGVARALGVVFIEGDDLHPPANVAKMASGQPLIDADRWPWLDLLRQNIEEHLAQDLTAVYSCSALKRSYRQRLAQDDPRVRFIHLDADFDLLNARLAQRDDHFMPAELLASQFATLEPPTPDEDIPRFDVSHSVEGIVEGIVDWVQQR